MSAQDYGRVAAAIDYLQSHADEKPSLDRVAQAIGVSPYHLQRVFSRWAGVSPKRFLQYLTLRDARARLRDGASVLEAAYSVGLSGGGRLHDLFVSAEAVTPGEFKSRGSGLVMSVGLHESPFGPALLGVTDRGVCALEFPDMQLDDAVALLEQRWRGAKISIDPERTRDFARRIFGGLDRGQPLPVLVRGTNFQLKVWEALLRIPAGGLASYADVARAVGKPSASRAVGNAVGANPIAFLIPCHRVIRESGAIGGYRWGSARKRAMLARERGITAA